MNMRKLVGRNVASSLKHLREETGLSIRKLAAHLGVAASTYANYEQRYKKRYLPWELVEKLIPIFLIHGIERERIIVLAGIGEALPVSEVNNDLLQNIIRKTEIALEEEDIHLKPAERAQLYVTMFQIAARHYSDGLTDVNFAFMSDFSRAIADMAKKSNEKG